jgi:hypothetical protein
MVWLMNPTQRNDETTNLFLLTSSSFTIIPAKSESGTKVNVKNVLGVVTEVKMTVIKLGHRMTRVL